MEKRLGAKWPHRLVVRTPGSHPGNRGSIPRGVTMKDTLCVKLKDSPIHRAYFMVQGAVLAVTQSRGED